jgi:hypothetical protein
VRRCSFGTRKWLPTVVVARRGDEGMRDGYRAAEWPRGVGKAMAARVAGIHSPVSQQPRVLAFSVTAHGAVLFHIDKPSSLSYGCPTNLAPHRNISYRITWDKIKS